MPSIGEVDNWAAPHKSQAASDALHLLGAMQVQELTKTFPEPQSDDEDVDDAGPAPPQSAASPDLVVPLRLLRAALGCLPDGAVPESHARVVNSLAAALILAKTAPGETAALLRRAARLAPKSWPVRANLVRVLKSLAKAEPKLATSIWPEVAAVLSELAELRPAHPGIFHRLAMAWIRIDKNVEARVALEKHLKAWDEFQAASKAEGETTATAPPEYVAVLFDSYADRFEEHLVTQLHYKTPGLLAELLGVVVGNALREWARCADLGCGTGLMGPPLRQLGFRGRLEGVDLSEGMLVKARAKGPPGVGYDRLLCGDCLDIFTHPIEMPSQHIELPIEHAMLASRANLPDESSRFDLVLAADVFVYIGDLAALFRTVAAWLKRPGGVFAFSTEALGEGAAEEYILTPTARYCHKPSYIRRLADEAGLRVQDCHAVVLRMNGGEPVHGHLHCLRHRA